MSLTHDDNSLGQCYLLLQVFRKSSVMYNVSVTVTFISFLYQWLFNSLFIYDHTLYFLTTSCPDSYVVWIFFITQLFIYFALQRNELCEVPLISNHAADSVYILRCRHLSEWDKEPVLCAMTFRQHMRTRHHSAAPT